MGEKSKKKNWSEIFSNPLLIIFAGICFCVVMTWFVSPGAFDRVDMDGRTIVVAGSYHEVA